MRRVLASVALMVAVVCGGGMKAMPDPAVVAEQAGLAGAAIAAIELNRDTLAGKDARRPVRAGALSALPLTAACHAAVAEGRWRWTQVLEPAWPYGPPAAPIPAARPLSAWVGALDQAEARAFLIEALGPERLASALSALGATESRFLPDGGFETTAFDMARMVAQLARARVVSPEASEAMLEAVRARRFGGLALEARNGMHVAVAAISEAGGAPAFEAGVDVLAKAMGEAAVAGSPRDWRRLPVVRIPSPRHSDRQGAAIDTIVLHHTVIGPDVREVAAYFRRPDIEASAHYIVGKDGTIVQAVDDCLKAWHAGVSTFKGRPGVNAYSIGIEIVNRGDGVDPYPDAQYRALARLVHALQREYGIPWDRVTGHRDVALPKGRKVDPSDNFSYARLRREVRKLESGR